MGCRDFTEPDPRDEALRECIAVLRRAKAWVGYEPAVGRYEMERAAQLAEAALDATMGLTPDMRKAPPLPTEG